MVVILLIRHFHRKSLYCIRYFLRALVWRNGIWYHPCPFNKVRISSLHQHLRTIIPDIIDRKLAELFPNVSTVMQHPNCSFAHSSFWFPLAGDVSKLVDEYILLLVLCCTKFYTYIVRAVRVINAFCDFLGIRCLVIPTSKQTDRTIVPKTSGKFSVKKISHARILIRIVCSWRRSWILAGGSRGRIKSTATIQYILIEILPTSNSLFNLYKNFKLFEIYI